VKKNPKFEAYLLEEANLIKKLAEVQGIIGFHGILTENLTNTEEGPSMVLEYCQYGSL